jgi:hypothetical protein
MTLAFMSSMQRLCSAPDPRNSSQDACSSVLKRCAKAARVKAPAGARGLGDATAVFAERPSHVESSTTEWKGSLPQCSETTSETVSTRTTRCCIMGAGAGEGA